MIVDQNSLGMGALINKSAQPCVEKNPKFYIAKYQKTNGAKEELCTAV